MLYPVFDFSVYSIKTPIKNIKHFLFDLKCCRDRIRKGYCEKDAWDMDRWFLEVVPGVLDCLREQVDSYPSNLPDKHRKTAGHPAAFKASLWRMMAALPSGKVS